MKYNIHPDLDKILKKLSKKDKVQFERILKKMQEIVNSPEINRYKNLRSPLDKYKRVHVHSSFVLLFATHKEKIIFRYYAHHDEIYKFRE